MHDAVPGRSVDEPEIGEPGRRAQNGVMVGRHLVESAPAAGAIDGYIPEDRHAMMGARNDPIEPCGIERGVVGVRAPGLHRPEQQHATIAHAEMKTVVREDGHRGGWRQDRSGNGQRHLAPHRRHREAHASQRRDVCGPRAGGIDDVCGGDASRSSRYGRDPVAVALETQRGRVMAQLGAGPHRGVEVPLQDPEGPDVSVGGAEAAARDTVQHDRRIEPRNVGQRHHLRLDEPGGTLYGDGLTKRRELAGVRSEEEVPHRLVAALATGHLVEVAELLAREEGELHVDGRGELGAEPAGGASGTAGA